MKSRLVVVVADVEVGWQVWTNFGFEFAFATGKPKLVVRGSEMIPDLRLFYRVRSEGLSAHLWLQPQARWHFFLDQKIFEPSTAVVEVPRPWARWGHV